MAVPEEAPYRLEQMQTNCNSIESVYLLLYIYLVIIIQMFFSVGR